MAIVGMFSERLYFATLISKLYQKKFNPEDYQEDGPGTSNRKRKLKRKQTMHLKNQKHLNTEDANTIEDELKRRRMFTYSFRDVISYLVHCIRCRKKTTKNLRNFEHHYDFEHGQYKLNQEIDIVHLLRSMRRLKLLSKVLLNKKQTFLLKFQNSNLVDVSNTEEESDTMDILLKKLEKGDEGVENQLKRTVSIFQKMKKLSPIDKKLL
jgi:hypothetical protein